MEQKQDNRKSVMMMVSSMLIFGTIGLFRRHIAFSSAFLAFARGMLGGLFLMALSSTKKKDDGARPPVSHLIVFAFAGVLMGINWILLFEAYTHTTVATATLCYYMEPTIVMLLSPFIFKERLTLKKLICAAAAIAGMVLVSGVAGQGGNQHPDNADKADQRDKKTEERNEADRLDGERRNAVKGQTEHLAQRIVAFSGNAFMPVIGNTGTLEPDQRHHAAQIQIDFFESGKFMQRTGAHQTIISVIIYDLSAHGIEQLIEALCRNALEEGVCITGCAHAVDNLTAVEIGIHHAVHGIDIVLPVTVNGNGDITAVHAFHKPGQHGVLVTAVSALGNALEMRILLREGRDDVPGSVPAPVIDEENPAVFRNLAGCGQVLELLQEHAACGREHFFFVIAGDNNVQYRWNHGDLRVDWIMATGDGDTSRDWSFR